MTTDPDNYWIEIWPGPNGPHDAFWIIWLRSGKGFDFWRGCWCCR